MLRLVTGEDGAEPTPRRCPIGTETVRVCIEIRVTCAPGASAAISLGSMMVPTPTAAEGGLRLTTTTAEPIGDAIAAWTRHLDARCKPSTVRRFIATARACSSDQGWTTVGSVTLSSASEWLDSRRASGWSGTTYDGAASTLRVFGRWLQRHRGLSANPLEHLEAIGEPGKPGARALTLPEVRALISSTIAAQIAARRSRGNRAMFYAILCLTGLRANEASRLRWGDVDLETDPPAIWTDPAWSKSRRRDRIVLDEAAALLRWHGSSVPSARGDPVFPCTPNRHTFSQDRERAGIRSEDARGRMASLHGLRKWLASQLDRDGASPGIVSRLLRHATTLAEARYIDPDSSLELDAVRKLPRLWPDSVPVPGPRTGSGPRSENPVKALDNDSDGSTFTQATPMNAHIPSPSASTAPQLGPSVLLPSPGRGALPADRDSERATQGRNGQGRAESECAESPNYDLIGRAFVAGLAAGRSA